MLRWEEWKVLDCTTFSRVPCVARLEVSKRGTWTRFWRQKWISDHCFWKVVVLKYCDHHMWRRLVGLSWSSVFSVPCPAHLPNFWPCWPAVAPGQPPDAWLWTHTGGSYTETTTSHRSLHELLLCGPNLATRNIGFLDFPRSSKLSTHAT